MNTEFEREFVRLKSISEVYNSKISLTFNNLDIFFSELGDEFRKSEIKVIWNKKHSWNKGTLRNEGALRNLWFSLGPGRATRPGFG